VWRVGRLQEGFVSLDVARQSSSNRPERAADIDLPKDSVGQQPRSAAIAICEGVYPDKAMMHRSHFRQQARWRHGIPAKRAAGKQDRRRGGADNGNGRMLTKDNAPSPYERLWPEGFCSFKSTNGKHSGVDPVHARVAAKIGFGSTLNPQNFLRQGCKISFLKPCPSLCDEYHFILDQKPSDERLGTGYLPWLRQEFEAFPIIHHEFQQCAALYVEPII